MRGTLTVARTEFRQHRLVLWAGLASGLLGIVSFSLARQASEPHFGALVLAWVVSVAVAFGLGLEAFSGDLRERRLGFWLARPLPLFQYWAGKMIVAYVLALVVFLLTLTPTLLLEAASGLLTLRDLRRMDVLALAVVMVLGVALAAGATVGGALRVRSRLLILDLVLLLLTWAAVVWALGRAWQAGTAQVIATVGMPRLVVVAVAILLAASAVQVCVGRLDLARGRALLSGVTWGGLLVFFFGGLVGFSRYVLGETPAELRSRHSIWVDAPQGGDHVMLAGTSGRWRWRYVPAYLVDSHGGVQALGGLEGVAGGAWSRDGKHFAWTREAFGPPDETARRGAFMNRFGWGPTLTVRHLDRPGPPTQLDLDANQVTLALSPAGERVLLGSRAGAQVIDTSSGRTIARLDDSTRWRHADFLTETAVRVLQFDDRASPGARAGGREQATVLDWDLGSGRISTRGTIALQGARTFLAGLTPGDDWQSVLRIDATGAFLHDLDGRVTAVLAAGWTRANRRAGPLSGGRYGVIEEEPAGLRLRVLAADARLLAEVLLPGRFPVRVGGEPRPGLLALEVAPLSEDGEQATLLVDIAAGHVERRLAGLSPAVRRWEPPNSLENTHVEAGSFPARLLLGDEGVLALDPATGATNVVVASRSRQEP